MTDMEFLFEPQSVAVIGASGDPGKIGYKVLQAPLTKDDADKISMREDIAREYIDLTSIWE